MDPIARMVAAGAAGASGSSATYVDDVFSTYLYSGNGGTDTIDNGIDLAGEGGLVWYKNRKNSWGYDHRLFDTERGANNYLHTNNSNLEASGTGFLTSFNSNGFTVENNGGFNALNEKYVTWSFRKAPGFFDVQTWTGNGTAGRTVSHNLGSVPGFIIIKATSTSTAWYCYHRSLGKDKYLMPNNTESANSISLLNSVDPTSTEFTLSGTGYNVNDNNVTYVAYLFAHDDQSFGTDSDQSIIKCGSYTGNGSTTGNVVDLGFEPQWLMIKKATGSYQDWVMLDNMRGVNADGETSVLYTNASTVETSSTEASFSSRGFQLRTQSNSTNSSGQTYVYMAIRRPHKPPTAGTEVYATDVGSSSSVIPNWDSGFPIDFALAKTVSYTDNWWTISRLTGSGLLQTHTTTQEVDGGINWVADSNVGWGKAYSNSQRSWMFRRAPGFMDVVTYTGTASLSGVNHNLGVTPELKIIKSRSHASDWVVGGSAVAGENGYLFVNSTAGLVSMTNYWDGGDDSATQFGVRNTNSASDYSGRTYVAYLFASLSGISKVGSYTGTGNNININCGFSAGARFVLIKRTDSTGDWYVWDTDRGIVSGNDPYLLLNSNAAEVTNTDYIDPLNAGFTVTSSAPAALNTNGGTYLFLAIA